MKLVKFGFPELSTGGKKSSQVCDLENRGFGQKFPKNTGKIWIFLFCGGQNSAGAHNKRLGPNWRRSDLLFGCPNGWLYCGSRPKLGPWFARAP